jgi:hypothetical protein
MIVDNGFSLDTPNPIDNFINIKISYSMDNM